MFLKQQHQKEKDTSSWAGETEETGEKIQQKSGVGRKLVKDHRFCSKVGGKAICYSAVGYKGKTKKPNENLVHIL